MNNPTNEEIKQIIDDAPDGATHVATYIDDMYLRKAVPLGMELFSPILGKWEWCKDVTILRNAKDLSDLSEILALRERVQELNKHCTNMTNQVSELMQETARQAMLVNELQAAKIDSVREFAERLWCSGEFSGSDNFIIKQFVDEHIKENTNERD